MLAPDVFLSPSPGLRMGLSSSPHCLMSATQRPLLSQPLPMQISQGFGTYWRTSQQRLYCPPLST